MSKTSPRASSADAERWRILIRAYLPSARLGPVTLGVAADLKKFDALYKRFSIAIVFDAGFHSPYFYFVNPWQLFGYEDLTEENLAKRLKYIKENSNVRNQ